MDPHGWHWRGTFDARQAALPAALGGISTLSPQIVGFAKYHKRDSGRKWSGNIHLGVVVCSVEGRSFLSRWISEF